MHAAAVVGEKAMASETQAAGEGFQNLISNGRNLWRLFPGITLSNKARLWRLNISEMTCRD
jgi:hypothetical protein